MIWVDDPQDRLIPGRDVLQALRVFANQAAAAIDAANDFEEVRYLAEHDSLTRLFNRRSFTRRLGDEAARSGRYHRPFALVLCDLDGFKQLNDRHGHEAGDAALALFGSLLDGAIRRSDLAFRIGGDEFALLLPETNEANVRSVVERISSGFHGSERGVPQGAAGELRRRRVPPRRRRSRGDLPRRRPGHVQREAVRRAAALCRMTGPGDKRSASGPPARPARGHPAGAQRRRGRHAACGDRPDDRRLAGLRRRRHQPVPPGVGRLPGRGHPRRRGRAGGAGRRRPRLGRVGTRSSTSASSGAAPT